MAIKSKKSKANAAKKTRATAYDGVAYAVEPDRASHVTKGFLAEYVKKAKTYKSFDRVKLESNWGDRANCEVPIMRAYFPYCVKNGIFVEAK